MKTLAAPLPIAMLRPPVIVSTGEAIVPEPPGVPTFDETKTALVPAGV